VISAFVEQDEGAVALNREAFHIAIDEPSGPRLLQRDRFEVVDRLTRFGQFVNIVAGIAAGSQGRVASLKRACGSRECQAAISAAVFRFCSAGISLRKCELLHTCSMTSAD
jgi:hypothetical protein